MTTDTKPFSQETLRTNYKIISSPQEPVYTSTVSSATQPVYFVNATNYLYAKQGQFYSASTGSVVVLTKYYLAFQVVNPSSSQKTINLTQFSAYTISQSSATGYVQFSIYRDALQLATVGTVSPSPLTIYNTNFGFSGGSSCTASYMAYSSNPVSGGTIIGTFIENTASPLFFDLGGVYVVPPNHTFTILMYNNTNTQFSIANGLQWLELLS